MLIPGRMFSRWAAINVVRCLVIGVLFGVAWTLTNIVLSSDTTRQNGDSILSGMQLLSVIVNSTFFYLLTICATVLGISVQTWGLFIFTLTKNPKMILNSWLWLLVLNVILNVVVTYYTIALNSSTQPIMILMFNIFLASAVGYHTGYRAYAIAAVHGKRGYKQYARIIKLDTNRFAKVASLFVPFYHYDKTRPGILLVPTFVIIFLSFLVASVSSGWVGHVEAFPFIYMVAHSLFFGLFALLVRLYDVVFGEPGEYRLHPFVEPEWTLTAKSADDHYAKEKAARKVS